MLLKTKLFVPKPPASIVQRERLTQILDAGIERKLTVVRAPAGFGKTSLVAHWITQRDYRVGWVSLDSADSDPARFTRHLIAAARQLHPTTCHALDLNDATQTQTLADVLPVLINDLAELRERSVLVLDDYHLIDHPDIHDGMTLLLEHTPQKLHLILMTRGEPALSLLPRLRVRGQVNEIASADLRFTTDEAAQFLQNMGVRVTAQQVALLEQRIEGWVAGLQLAAVTMQGRDDVAQFIDTLSGRHQYIVDYLAEEALRQRSADTRQFLLQTSVLEELTADLCNAVTQRTDSQHILARLQRQNLFIIPLDETGEWYRYHQFFDDFLGSQLERHAPDHIPELNRRAADWFLAHDQPRIGIKHLLIAQDYTTAATQITNLMGQLIVSGELAIVDKWLSQLPTTLIEESVALSLGYALTRVRAGDWRTAAARLEKLVVDAPPNLQALRLLIESEIALRRDQLPLAIDRAEQALRLLSPSLLRTHVVHQLLHQYALAGDLVNVRRMYEDLTVTIAPTVYAELNQLVEQGDSALSLGRLHEAARHYRQGIRRAGLSSLEQLPIVGAMHVGLGRVLHEWGEWAEAEKQLKHGLTLIHDTTLTGRQLLASTTLHRLMRRRGVQNSPYLAQAKTLIRAFNIAQLSAMFAAVEAEAALRRGDVEVATRWVRESQLPVAGVLVHLHTLEYRIMAEVLLARDRFVEALQLLTAIEAAAAAADQRLLLVEVIILQAVVLHRQGEEAQAVVLMRRGVTSAEVEAIIRPFTHYPKETIHLLRQLTDLDGFLPDFVDDLLTALGVPDAPTHTPDSVAPLLDALTDRELDVLTYLVQGYSNQAIADAMFVAVSTVRTHLRNLYGKLDARSRTHAIVRARELNLVST